MGRRAALRDHSAGEASLADSYSAESDPESAHSQHNYECFFSILRSVELQVVYATERGVESELSSVLHTAWQGLPGDCTYPS